MPEIEPTSVDHAPYQAFQQALQQFQQQLEAADANLPAALQPVQQQFQIILAASETTPPLEAKLQSYQTEANRLLRLLAMDVMFLHTARHSQTAAQRRSQVGDRVEQLLAFCALMSAEGEG